MMPSTIAANDLCWGPVTTVLKMFQKRGAVRATDRGWSVTLTLSAIAGFPHPILVSDGDGTLSPANPAAVSLCKAVEEGGVSGIAQLIERAKASSEAQIEVVMVPAESGAQLFEMVVLPLLEGGALLVAKDVTLESSLRSVLVESRQRYKDLVEVSSDFAWEIGPDGTFGFVSPRGALGYGAAELVGRRPEDFAIPHPGVDSQLPFHSDQPVEDAEIWMRRADGTAACLRASSSPMCDSEGNRRGARGVWKDVTRERERETALARANNRERLMTYVVRTIRDVADPPDMLRTAAGAASRAFGAIGAQICRHADGAFVPAASDGQTGSITEVLAAMSESETFEGVVDGLPVLAQVVRYRREVNGAVIVWRSADGRPWNDDDRYLMEGLADQIGIANEQVSNHERIVALSRTDALTGLFNRRAFFEELSRRFERLARDTRPAALIYVDLDNFKAVNDRHGHARGDEALMAVREILVRHTRPSDLIARLGGDEFAVWLEGADEATAIRRCDDIISAAQALMSYSGGDHTPLTMSLGVAVHAPDQRELLDDLLQRADEAMYRAKNDRKGSYRLAGPVPLLETSEGRD